jgi:Fe-S-cluster containining protein
VSAERFMEEGRWKCIQCGACCRIAGLLIPEWDRGDGACQHLTDENLCAIYELRPAICRTESMPASDRLRAEACASLAERFEVAL